MLQGRKPKQEASSGTLDSKFTEVINEALYDNIIVQNWVFSRSSNKHGIVAVCSIYS